MDRIPSRLRGRVSLRRPSNEHAGRVMKFDIAALILVFAVIIIVVMVGLSMIEVP
jgi:hypothetical protein